MLLDIAAGAIISLSAAWGYRRGFIHTFLHTAGWLFSMVLSFAWYPMISKALKEKTGLYDTVQQGVAQRLADSSAEVTEQALNGIPSVLKDATDVTASILADSFASGLCDLLFSILSIVIITFGIKFIFFLLVALFSKRTNDGLTGWADGVFGALFGAVKAVFLILVLLALLVLFSDSPSAAFLMDALDQSTVIGTLYDRNPLLLFIPGLFTSSFFSL